MLFIAIESWDKVLHKTNCVTLYLCPLEEVDHSETRRRKSDIKSVHRQMHCDKGFVREVLSNCSDHKLEFCLVDRVPWAMFLRARIASHWL